MRSNRLRRWLRRRGIYTGRLRRVAYVATQAELPDVPRASEMAVVGTTEAPKWLLIDCPCGYGHTILLPLSRRMQPHWSLEISGAGRPSVHPSIDRNRDEGVRCHFWIRDGEVQWA